MLQKSKDIISQSTRFCVATRLESNVSIVKRRGRVGCVHWFKGSDEPWLEMGCVFRVKRHQKLLLFREVCISSKEQTTFGISERKVSNVLVV